MKTIVALIFILGSLAVLRAAPIESQTIHGDKPGPTVRVIVGRAELPKTMGIDKQLAGFRLMKGRLLVETWETLEDSVPSYSGDQKPDLEIILRWSDDVPGLKRKPGGTPLTQLPHISGTKPDTMTSWFKNAAKDSYPKDQLEAHVLGESPLVGIQQAVLHFPAPRDGAVRSRQTRLSRRFVGNALEAFGMIDPQTEFWPSGLDVSKVICIYDAEGCGYIGSVRLERVVNRTTLDNQVAMICHEDLREGALNEVQAVVFPGGTAGGIVNALKPDGVTNVRDFVENGGAYLGVCAGAYFSGSGSSKYARLNHLVQHQPWLKGQKELKMELTPEGIEILGEEFRTFTNRYNNGPVFLDISDPPTDSPFKPIINLAVFKEGPTRRGVTHDVMIDTSGIHATTFGKGRVLNISAHPETHEELDVMVGRCFGWALGVPKEKVNLIATDQTSLPVKTTTIEGKEPGPTVRVIVGRTERAKTIGLDRQLAGIQLTKGRLIIETYESGKPIHPGLPESGKPDWEIVCRWSDKPPGLAFSETGRPLSQLPRVKTSDPGKAQALLNEAVGGTFTKSSLASLDFVFTKGHGSGYAELHFVEPQTGIPRSRQLRLARRFTAGLLADLEMMEPFKGVLPPGVDASKMLCIYDANGTGFNGPPRLERIIDETTLDYEVMMICGEDIREGLLNGARGIVIPGGGARSIALAMRPDGVKRVNDFIEAGGSYIGVCAGAYFPTSGMKEYSGISHLKHSSPWMKGSGDLKVELTPEGIELLGSEFKSFSTRYNNGPVFPDIGPPPEGSPQQPVTSLAVFKESSKESHDYMIDTPAILTTRWGKGRLLTISPHPESHEELTMLVARCFGWALGVPKEAIRSLK